MRERSTWDVEAIRARARAEQAEKSADPYLSDLDQKTPASVLGDLDDLLNKADVCVQVAELMLPTASDNIIEDQAVRLMALGNVDLIETYLNLCDEKNRAERRARLREIRKNDDPMWSAARSKDPSKPIESRIRSGMRVLYVGDGEGIDPRILDQVRGRVGIAHQPFAWDGAAAPSWDVSFPHYSACLPERDLIEVA